MSLYENLFWLPRCIEGWRASVDGAKNLKELSYLLQYSLDESQLIFAAKKGRLLGASDKSLPNFKLGILSYGTLGNLPDALLATGIRHGLYLDAVYAGYDQAQNEIFSTESTFFKNDFKAILLGLEIDKLPYRLCPGNADLASKLLNDVSDYLKRILEEINKKSKSHIIIQNFSRNLFSTLGNSERSIPGTQQWFILKINNLIDELTGPNISVLDVDGLSGTVGLTNWHSEKYWNLAKIPFNPVFLPLYCDYIARIAGALSGKSRRCLIMDLDNTIWGGVIGDDGIEGIELGNGSASGEAFLRIQKIFHRLRDQGAILAVSSKNNEETAKLPFQKHPEMVLREEHIAEFRANWLDKAENIRQIAKSLNLGLESMIFVDDNPAERLLVRTELPQVAVPELPKNADEYLETIFAAGYFESVGLTSEDLLRASFYQENQKRISLQATTSNMEDYLSSLKMEMHISSFDSIGRSRIVQLIGKSNQFNLTTKRYTEAEVESIELDPSFIHLQVRLKDIFGDNGMIAVVILKRVEETLLIDTWLMSCRVLERGVELAIMHFLTKLLDRDPTLKKIVGLYVPTQRNVLVKDHYAKLGFMQVGSTSASNEWLWERGYELRNHPTIKVVDHTRYLID